MRVQLKMEGGIAFFPGLSKPIIIDSDQLSRQEADELKRLVDAAHFFELPTTMPSPARGAADYRQYTITIQDGSKLHTVHLTDPIEDPNLQALLAYLRARR
jgi:hypothetical protein